MRRLSAVLILCLAAALPLRGAITGTVVTADGQPIAGAKIALYPVELADARWARFTASNTDRTPLAVTTSDAKGKFSLDSKEAVAEVHISGNGYAPTAFRAERDEERGAIPLTAAANKQGRVTAGGKSVTGARIILTGSGSEYSTTTDGEGRYSAPDPSKWADWIVISHSDYATFSESTRRFMDSGKVSLDRTLDSGTSITGRVLAEDGKTSIAGATLTIDGVPAGKSGDDGTFTVAHAPKKWQTIRASHGKLVGLRAAGSKDAVIKLAKSAELNGSVRDAKTKTPVAGAEVTLRQAGRFQFRGASLPSAITDAKGNFVLTAIPPGSYEVSIVRPGYTAPSTSVSLAANDRATKNLAATQMARVTGTVIDENKQAVAGTRIEGEAVSRETGPMMRDLVAVQRAITAPDGTFVVRVAPEVDVQVAAAKKGFPTARSSTMRLAPGERKSGVTLTIPMGFELTGRVTDRRGNPVSGVAVGAIEAAGGPSAMIMRRVVNFGGREEEDLVQTDGQGRFTLRLKEGSYDVAFKREGFASKAVRSHQVNASAKPIEITLEPGVELSGRVTRGGAGVEGVRIGVMGEQQANTETGPDGSFRLTDLSPGDSMLFVNKPDEFIQQNRQITIPSSDIHIELPPGGRIAGRVVDKVTKQPVTNFDAGVSAPRGGGGMIIMGPPMSKHFTTDDGSFVLENVPPGQTSVVVNAPGYVAGRVSNIVIEEGKTVADIEVQMDRGVKVSGRVTGPDGSGLAGVSVRIEQSGTRVMRGIPMGGPNVVTDASGDYVMEAVEAGERTFAFSRSGYLPAEKTVDVSGSDARVDAQLSAGLRVSGVVVTDSGVPVADANVFASSAGQTSGRNARTDANGAFQIEGLAPGRYTFRASKSGQATGTLRDIDIAAGVPIRITLATGGTITGRISGLSAEELQQVQVQAGNSSGNASGPTDASGNFRIEGAPTGTVRVTAMLGGYSPGRFRTGPSKSVQLEPGGTAQVDLEFVQTTIRGRISYDGKPASGAMVMFVPQKGEAQTQVRTTTDNNGQYEAAGLDDATYDIVVTDMQRGTPYMTTYEVRGSSTFNIDIKSTQLRGRVTDASSGQAIEEAAVMIRPTTETLRFPLRTVTTDASGAFTLDSVPPGSYSISAEKAGYGTKLTDITVGDSPVDVDLKLSPNAGVTLKVIDGRDGRLINAFVRVVDARNVSVYDSPPRFGTGGTAEPIKLPLESGAYRVTIFASGYATKVVPITSPSSPTVAMTPGGSIAVISKASVQRRARLMMPDGREYPRGMGGFFNVDPGTYVMENIAPGSYTLQILGAGDRVEASAPVNVMEGQRVSLEI